MKKPAVSHGVVLRSDFVPARWARNCHIQTLWPRFVQKRRPVTYTMARCATPDNDFFDVAWGPKPQRVGGIVVMFHGLEGSIRSHYANDMMAALTEQNWQVAMVHFRGCSGEPNLQPRAYHSGDTQDAIAFLESLAKRYPDLPKVAIGFSLGANMLLKLLGEHPDQTWLQGAMAVSPPMKLAECSASLNRGFSRVYQTYLLKSMKQNLLKKMQLIDYGDLIRVSAREVPAISSFREFDDRITAPLHGYADAEDYYEKCSAFPFLKAIHCPTLIVHSLDDPFMNPNVVPTAEDLSRAVTLELSEYGGHVGFMQDGVLSPTVWLQSRAISYFKQFLYTNEVKE